ncbi:MAG: polysaccharide deacetylase family protein [Candidatus Omnitrophica bacterium]|nr:polysaccharide deacetylase family protein [Candidatus Omnitrophota bacterium]
MKLFRKISLLLIAALLTLGLAFYFFYMRPRHVVPILMYHAIGDDDSSLYVTDKNFSRQAEFLKKEGYNIISLKEFVGGIKEARDFPAKTVVITFDDGYEDNYISAFPVLAKYDMPATIFLITDHVDNKKGYLKWDQVRLMMNNGIDFGGHTRNNAYLPDVKSTQALWEEIYGSREDIKTATGKEADFFCYPTGGFNEEIKRMVKKAGYKGACTTNRGFDRLNKDVYELKRVKVTNSDTNKPFHFRAKLSGYYNLFRSAKRGH